MKTLRVLFLVSVVSVLLSGSLIACDRSSGEADFVITQTEQLPTATVLPAPQSFEASLTGVALTRYEQLFPKDHAVIDVFAAVAGYDAAVEWLLALPGDGRPDVLPSMTVYLPNVEDALSEQALTKLKSMYPLIKDSFADIWDAGIVAPITLPSDPKMFVPDRVKELETRILAAPTEFPPVEDIVSPRSVGVFEELHPYFQEMFWKDVAFTYAAGMRLVGTEGIMEGYDQLIPWYREWQTREGCDDHAKDCVIGRPAPPPETG